MIDQTAGRAEPRTGKVLHTYHSLFAFLHNRDYTENGGVFVVYAQQLTSATLRAKQAARDTTKQNPDSQLMPPPPAAVAGTAAKPRRDRLLGQRVKIAGPGGFKGKEGRVKDINPTSQLCRIELSATNKIVTVHKSKCMMVASMCVSRERLASLRLVLTLDIQRGRRQGCLDACRSFP